jgi:hypothetical protein
VNSAKVALVNQTFAKKFGIANDAAGKLIGWAPGEGYRSKLDTTIVGVVEDAKCSEVKQKVLRQVAIMTLVGTLVGLAGALGVGQAAQLILFEMTGADPTVLALSAVALALVALCAGFIPAHRASRVDPMRALKYE